MRRFRILAIAALLAACDTTVTSNSTISPLPPPDPGIVTTVTTDAPSLPVTTHPSAFTYRTYRGVLPNGVDYVARIPGDRVEDLTVVVGTFSYMSDSGPVPVGDVVFRRVLDSRFEVGYDAGTLLLQNWVWVVEVAFDISVLTEMGDGAEETATRSISLDVVQETPVIQLSAPFTWVGGDAQIRYQTFVVASGCWEEAVRCTENRVVQVVSATDAFTGTSGLSSYRRDGTAIETNSPRPVSDPNYLDPGPLSERLSADVIWTGEEMIVWGGKQNRDGLTTLVDGAAFDPKTNEWRMLAPIPLEGPRATRAIWGDGEMIVVSPDGTFGYDPGSDSWRVLGSGVVPSEWHDRMVFFEGKVYMWERSSQIGEFDVTTGQWRAGSIEVPESTYTYNNPFFGTLRAVDDHLVAIIIDGSVCFGKTYWEWLGDTWEELPHVSLATESYADCSTANQAAGVGSSLVIWDEDSHAAAAYSFASGEWREIPSIPLGGAEGPSGPVFMDASHFMVPRWDGAAVFDATSETWTHSVLPGAGSDAEIVWTGTEFLAWGIWETFDAWRWAPPEGPIP